MRLHIAGVRIQTCWDANDRAFCIWVPWREAGRPMVYLWWRRQHDHWVKYQRTAHG